MIDLLYEALSAEYGVTVTTSNPVACRNKLYKIMAENPGVFDEISILISRTKPNEELWLVKKGATYAAPQE